MYKSIIFIQIPFDEFVGFSSGLRLNLAKFLAIFLMTVQSKIKQFLKVL